MYFVLCYITEFEYPCAEQHASFDQTCISFTISFSEVYFTSQNSNRMGTTLVLAAGNKWCLRRDILTEIGKAVKFSDQELHHKVNCSPMKLPPSALLGKISCSCSSTLYLVWRTQRSPGQAEPKTEQSPAVQWRAWQKAVKGSAATVASVQSTKLC